MLTFVCLSVSVKVSSLGHQQLGRKSAALWVAAVLWLPLGSVERAGLLASESLGWLRCIPLQLVLVAVADVMAMAQMSKLHLSS